MARSRAHDGFGAGRGQLGRAEDGDPRVGVPCHEPERARAGGRDRERHPRLLHARRTNAGFVHRVVRPLVRHRRLTEEAIEELDELGQTRDELRRWKRVHAEDRRVEADAAGPDTEDEASVGDVVGGDDVLRECHRVSHVRRRHHRAEPHAVVAAAMPVSQGIAANHRRPR